MPIHVKIDRESHLIRTVIEGDVGAEEVFRSIERLIEDPAYSPDLPMLSDHRAVGRPLSTEDAHQIAAKLRSIAKKGGGFEGSCWAAVTKKPASYGMIRMLSALLEDLPMEVEVFDSMEEAEVWLAKRTRARRRGPR